MTAPSPRTAGRFAIGVAGLMVCLFAASVGYSIASSAGFDPLDSAFIFGIGVTFAAVGVVIARRQPGNAIAWLFLAAGLGAGLAALSGSYADYWVGSGAGSEALGKTAAIYGDTSWVPFILLPVTFLLLLFPDGHLPSRRWRAVAWSAGAGIAATFVSGLLKPGRISDYPQVRNLLGVDAGWVHGLEALGALLVMVGLVGSVAALAVRFRRARGSERQQMKWLAYSGAVAAATLPVALALYDSSEVLANSAIMLTVLGIPAATGVAILRHRLYDIDVVINRTLVYAALTLTLAVTYLASVLVLQLVLQGITPGSGFAVALSTLAAAAVVRPARARIQGTVDRRFFRRRYDAGQTLESFGGRLRDELDVDALSAELRWVVAETMQPAHVSLWLPGAER